VALALAVARVMGGEKECRCCCVRRPGKSTYVRCRGIIGPVAKLDLLFPFNIFFLFSFLLHAVMLLCSSIVWHRLTSPHLITPRHHLSDWKGVKCCALPHRFKNTACVKVLHSHEDSIHSFQLVDSNNC
jgi:hypothetical protein